MKHFLLALTLLLAACRPPGALMNGDDLSLTLKFRLTQARSLAAAVTPWAKADINHLLVRLYTVSAGVETLVASQDNVNIEAGVTFGHLKHATSYRVRATGYRTAGTNDADRITDDVQSIANFSTLLNDALSAPTLPIYLLPRPFSATANIGAVSVTAGGLASSPRGATTVIAGPQGTWDGLSSPAAQARFNSPYSLAAAPGGGFYIVDRQNFCVRRFDPASGGTVTLVAGQGSLGTSQVGTAVTAQFAKPANCSAASDGTLYVIDQNASGNTIVKKVTPGGVVSRPSWGNQLGTNLVSLACHPSGLHLYAVGYDYLYYVSLSTGAVTPLLPMVPGSHAMTWGPDDTLYILLDTSSQGGSYALYKLPLSDPGDFSSSDGNGTATPLTEPGQLACGLDHKVYVTGYNSNKLYRVDPDASAVETLTNGGQGFFDGAAATAAFWTPRGILQITDPSSALYGKFAIADQNNNLVRLYDPSGNDVSTLAGTPPQRVDASGTDARFVEPKGLAAADDDTLYLADGNCIRKLARNGSAWQVSTLAGSETSGYAEGVGSAARFKYPSQLAMGPDGLLYVADTGNQRVRCIDPDTGATTLFAGTGGAYQNNVDRLSAGFGGNVLSLAFDSSGNLFVSTSSSIQRIDAATGLATNIQTGSKFAGLAFARNGDGSLDDGHLLVGRSGLYALTHLTYDSLSGSWQASDVALPFAGSGADAMGFGPDGKLYLTALGTLRQIDPDTGGNPWSIGTGTGYSVSNTDVLLRGARGLTFTPSGKLYLSDSLLRCVFRVD